MNQKNKELLERLRKLAETNKDPKPKTRKKSDIKINHREWTPF